MKRIMFFTVCLCTMLLSFTSCGGKDNALVGKWEQTINQMGVKAVATYDFKENGKLTQSVVMKKASPKINIVGDGTCDYTFDGNTITFRFSASDFNFDSFEIEGLGEEAVAYAMEEMKSEMVGMEQKLTDVKIEGDKLTAKFNGQELELNRI